ncbi:RTX toxin/Ca2+-binding protein [Sulfitobacter donghicola DSW-25 = KCTC 12864 = JCM 14565]|uniref:hypothetical protein n=1 Tax=Sulfitobacter donghicola TaxID=421000 RepID=UPI00046A9C9A|nr:hypothetical protein [Sulfitobacter donghicola]KIN70392.1 RTX toxin/Ca2+-binding protein [Sulfitobacter donghicola DSW-25 = KCTC 12864 = JCM 14565]
MTVDIYAPTSQDTLSLEELQLYQMIMDYRTENGLSEIPLSFDLTLVAGRHTLDTTENIWAEGVTLPEGANLHSWSDAFYYGDHRAPEIMWEAPERLGTDYPGFGFEISAAGYRSIEDALAGWQTSSGHNEVILNQGIWADTDWNAIGVGVELSGSGGGFFGGRAYHVWFGREMDTKAPLTLGTDASELITGSDFIDRLLAGGGDDTVMGGDGADTINGGDGADVLYGGETAQDLRDVIFGGAGNDSIEGGYGNDALRGDGGNDTIAGSFGADTVIGGEGDDQLTGSAFGDLLFGSGGDDFINGGFGSDLVNGGNGADEFFHIGIANHGSDWIQDYDAAQGDVLVFGNEDATGAQFQINEAVTEGSGADDVSEAFVIYRPTGQIMWALVDGMGQDSINIQIDGQLYDLVG